MHKALLIFSFACFGSSIAAAEGNGRLDVAVMAGGSGEIACPESGTVVGLDPGNDGFLSVRSGPGGRAFREIDRLYNGMKLRICDRQGPWYGVVYNSAGNAEGCLDSPWTRQLPYTGPCHSGWIHSHYVGNLLQLTLPLTKSTDVSHDAAAQDTQGEKAKRHAIVPYILDLTKCIAAVAEADPQGLDAYKNGRFGIYVTQQFRTCKQQLEALLERYEDIYGEGEAEKFVKGPYSADLERAVLSLIKPQLDEKLATLNQAAADEARREADARAAEVAQRDRELAEQRQREEEAKVATIKAEAEAKAAAAKAEAEQKERIDTSERTISLLRDKLYNCTDHELSSLVRSGETAEVLANAAITICGEPLKQLQDAGVEEFDMTHDSNSEAEQEMVRAQVKSAIKESVVASAVQAKARSGAFAPPVK